MSKLNKTNNTHGISLYSHTKIVVLIGDNADVEHNCRTPRWLPSTYTR